MNGHLRGRVRVTHFIWTIYGRPHKRPVYEWAVINTSTGQVVARDNSCQDSLGHAMDQAVRLVRLCREVHTREIRLKTLKEHR